MEVLATEGRDGLNSIKGIDLYVVEERLQWHNLLCLQRRRGFMHDDVI